MSPVAAGWPGREPASPRSRTPLAVGPASAQVDHRGAGARGAPGAMAAGAPEPRRPRRHGLWTGGRAGPRAFMLRDRAGASDCVPVVIYRRASEASLARGAPRQGRASSTASTRPSAKRRAGGEAVEWATANEAGGQDAVTTTWAWEQERKISTFVPGENPHITSCDGSVVNDCRTVPDDRRVRPHQWLIPSRRTVTQVLLDVRSNLDEASASFWSDAQLDRVYQPRVPPRLDGSEAHQGRLLHRGAHLAGRLRHHPRRDVHHLELCPRGEHDALHAAAGCGRGEEPRSASPAATRPCCSRSATRRTRSSRRCGNGRMPSSQRASWWISRASGRW